jgi:hypothetical protein
LILIKSDTKKEMPVVSFFSGAKPLNIDLEEPVVILRGTTNDSTTHTLRGEVNVVLTRPILCSKVIIKFVGKSHTLWPEGMSFALFIFLINQY